MVYVLHIRSLSVIASQMYFMHAFFLIYFFSRLLQGKEKGEEKKEREREKKGLRA